MRPHAEGDSDDMSSNFTYIRNAIQDERQAQKSNEMDLSRGDPEEKTWSRMLKFTQTVVRVMSGCRGQHAC